MCIETSVDTALRIALVLLHLLTVGGGFMTGIGLGWATRIFKERCVLYSDMHLSMSKNSTVYLNWEETEWSSIHMCYYCTFSTGMASVYGIIWYWFYFLLSEWDKTNNSHFDWSSMIPIKTNSNRPPPDSKLLFPTLLLNIVLWICVAVSLAHVTKGTNIWCKSVYASLNQQCSHLQSVEWANVENGESVYLYLRIAQAGNWILMFSMLAQVLVVGCRIYLYVKRDSDATNRATTKRRPLPRNTALATGSQLSASQQEAGHRFSELLQGVRKVHSPSSSDDGASSNEGDPQSQPLLSSPRVTLRSPNRSSNASGGGTVKLSHVDVHRSIVDDDDDVTEQAFKYNTL